MLNLAGYGDFEPIYRSGRTLVYRGRSDDGVAVVVKTPASTTPTPAELEGLAAEFRIGSTVEHPNLIRHLALERDGLKPALVMEDFGGRALAAELGQGPLEPSVALGIALQVAEALAALHGQGVTHKDINPSNLVLGPSGAIKVIDYSIASPLRREGVRDAPSQVVEGTIAYISPEQTGRTARTVDFRTDLYSLGVTLYQMLTGRLPFVGDDAMELVHAHLARVPRPPHRVNEAVPEAVSRVVLKLMAKTAEQRYHSAAGLAADLRRCLDAMEHGETLDDFEPGVSDHAARFSVPERLYGRQEELTAARQVFDLVADGSRQLLLLAGVSGIGKSSLAGEARLWAAQQRGWMVHGKFEQGANETPYSGWNAAARDLIRQLLAEPEAALSAWRAELNRRVDSNVGALVQVLPELGSLLEVAPPPPSSAEELSRRRFAVQVRGFVAATLTVRRPLVVVLDDLQWADPASLKLLESVLAAEELHHLMIIATYRDDETPPSHPLHLTRQTVEDGPAGVTARSLGPLDRDAVRRLVADTLGHDEDLEAAAEVVFRRTGGNPLFVTQLLTTAHERGVICFDAEAHRWRWDADAAETLPMSEDVVGLLVDALDQLPEQTGLLVRLASQIGSRFTLGTLAELAQLPLPEVMSGLRPALDLGVVRVMCGGFGQMLARMVGDASGPARDAAADGPLTTAHRCAATVECEFDHDRVRQAAAQLLGEEETARIQLTLGRQLLASLDEDALEGRLFEVVGHFQAGLAGVTEPAEKLAIARLFGKAGHRLMMTGGRNLAQQLFFCATQLLPDDADEQDHGIVFSLRQGLLTSLVLQDGAEEQALALGWQLLDDARDLTERLDVLRSHTIQLSTRGRDPHRALELGMEALAECGIDLTPDDSERAKALGYQELKKWLQKIDLEQLLALPVVSDPRLLAEMHLLESLFIFPIYMVRRDLGPLAALAGIRHTLRHGRNTVTGAALATAGAVMAHDVGDFRAGARMVKLGSRVSDAMDAHQGTTVLVGFTAVWPARSAVDTLTWVLDEHRRFRELDQPVAVAMTGSLALAFGLTSGQPLDELLEHAELYNAYTAENMSDLGMREGVLLARFAETLVGRRPLDPLLYVDAEEQARAEEQMRVRNNLEAYQTAQLLRSRLLLLFGDPRSALAEAEDGARPHGMRVGHYSVYQLLFCQAVAAAQLWHEAGQDEKPSLLNQIIEIKDNFTRWCDGGAGPSMGVWRLVIAAELARIQRKNGRAMRLYEAAIAASDIGQMLGERALCAELAARFYGGCQLDRLARVYLREAHYSYQRWGATAKVAQLEQRFPELSAPMAADGTTVYSPDDTTATSQTTLLDYATVLKATREISREMDLSRLLSALLSALVENAGAQRGVLLLNGKDTDRNKIPNNEGVEAPRRQGARRAHTGGMQPTSNADGVDGSAAEGNIYFHQPPKDEPTVRAAISADSDEPELAPHTPLDRCGDRLSVGIVRYVARTGEAVVLADAARRGMFRADPYVAAHRSRSLLCAPMTNRGVLVGLVYLENNLTPGAFAPARLEVVNLLCAQAAVSIRNAELFGELEHKVRQRTAELEQKNSQLAEALALHKQMQQQLVLREKMASLGTLVAGVAHELNTPMGALRSSNDTAARVGARLKGVLGDQLEKSNKIKKLLKGLADSQQVVDGASARIDQIVTSLRNFARLDEAELKRVDLHEGLDSTLDLLGHRLHSGVILHKEYGDLRLITCYPNQLNQVFVNLIGNALDAVERAGGKGTVTVRTAMEGERALVQVSDDGPGIPAAEQSRVFDPGYTTKGVGVGTGLGLSIAYTIVVQRHGGTIAVESHAGQGATFSIRLPRTPVLA